MWVAPKFRDEYRRALDWLNERTDLGISFFGVEVGVVQIGDDGPRAPVFEVVARPNDWQKSVKGGSAATANGTGVATPLNAQRQEFYAEILSEFTTTRPSVRMPARATGHWVQFASGPFGYWAISAAATGRFRVEAYIDSGIQEVNKALFDEFVASADTWQAAVGFQLDWERLDDRRASRIATYHDISLDNDDARIAARAWASNALNQMYTVLNEPLRTRAKALRSAFSTASHAIESPDQGPTFEGPEFA